MTNEEVHRIIRNYLAQYPISRIGIFGSFARNEHTPESDIDILVTYDEPVNLFILARMHRELSELLDREVDIVSEKYLDPRIKPEVEQDLKIITV
ncbi:nucleotidyltransferase family protein [Phaeodactylibacter sp.]|uniref:nucleotidyltransferase family protein n=1 Tax=Phaeodactylibacter sp. TaxID=1940289 RepID=UPI0025EE33AA|nr:nucleotidyltransferase family protein [Phaeodactylibacter sp.]MCI4648968.1 nucleotidyltransferase family protein [Phaeodactylibacter sp.]MCI5092911.1 nucleotidyltransferase family protein [Phaeodactylibacter sp.]